MQFLSKEAQRGNFSSVFICLSLSELIESILNYFFTRTSLS